MIDTTKTTLWKLSGFLVAASMTGVGVGLMWSEAAKSRIPVTTSHEPPRKLWKLVEKKAPAALICRPVEDRPKVMSPPVDHPLLPGFRGDTLWIHRREGHVGKPYWPGGASGVTLDPGMDLGHAEPGLIEEAFGPRLPKYQLRAVRKAMGAQGLDARAMLRRSTVLHRIQVSRSTAAGVFPYVLRPYWLSLQKRFSSVAEPHVPAEVQTALLSLAYNRGTWNPDLNLLHLPLETRQWNIVAQIIQSMQQDHLLEGIRRRRRIEGLLISQNLVDKPIAQICRRAERSETKYFSGVQKANVAQKENQEPEP